MLWLRARLRLLLALGGLALGCVPIPAHVGSSIFGRVVDAGSGAPIAGAIVVVRFDGRLDPASPWEPLGHREAASDATGRFATDTLFAPGFRLWPWVEQRARIASVIAPGYRCLPEHAADGARGLRIALAPGDDAAARASCRPVAASPREAPRYSAAWQRLHRVVAGAPPATPPDLEARRSLEARVALGFGANCRGPVVGLTLSEDGTTVELAYETETGLAHRTRPLHPTQPLPAVAAAPPAPDERAFELVLTETSASRSPAAWLHIAEPGGPPRELPLPGTACGAAGRFGRPQQRIGAGGRIAVDLRYVEGGCHAIAIDLASARWWRLDEHHPAGVTPRATCSPVRHLPRNQLQLALPAYAHELERRIRSAGLDPNVAFSLLLDDTGATTIEVPTLDARTRHLEAPNLPLATPLRAIHIGVLAPRSPRPPPARPANLEPL